MTRRAGTSHAPLPRLHVNFASPGYTTARLLQAALVLVGLVSLGYGGWSWTEAVRLDEQTARQAKSVVRAEAMNRTVSAALVKEGLTRPQAEIEEVYRRVEFANQLAQKRGFSWTRLLNHLEVAIPPRTSVQSVRLDFRESAVHLTGRVRTLGELDALAASLDGHQSFHRVRIMNHRFQEIEEERPAAPSTRAVRPASKAVKPRKHRVVEFELSVRYDGHPEGRP